mmetsp:Transcript_97625/g.178461  ORF Transcript_97625/g.178461 Transcript_97625/m.178461 type:complete len:262 (-) Transcript_97625:110-895(-)
MKCSLLLICILQCHGHLGGQVQSSITATGIASTERSANVTFVTGEKSVEEFLVTGPEERSSQPGIWQVSWLRDNKCIRFANNRSFYVYKNPSEGWQFKGRWNVSSQSDRTVEILEGGPFRPNPDKVKLVLDGELKAIKFTNTGVKLGGRGDTFRELLQENENYYFVNFFEAAVEKQQDIMKFYIDPQKDLLMEDDDLLKRDNTHIAIALGLSLKKDVAQLKEEMAKLTKDNTAQLKEDMAQFTKGNTAQLKDLKESLVAKK